MFTDAAFKSALKAAPTCGNSTIELKDVWARGETRLEPIKARRSVERFAVWYSGKRRSMAKIETYPTMTVAQARKVFAAG